MKCLSEAGLRLKKSKCHFMQPILECLGYRIDETGIYPVEAKVKAVQEAPAPRNVTELKAYLGLLNFYGKFLPNLATEFEPLYISYSVTIRDGNGTQNRFMLSNGLRRCYHLQQY